MGPLLFLREVFIISYRIHEPLMLIFLQQLTPLGRGNIFLKLGWLQQLMNNRILGILKILGRFERLLKGGSLSVFPIKDIIFKCFIN